MSSRNSWERKQERKKLKKAVREQLEVEAVEVIVLLKDMPWLHRLGLATWLLFLPKAWMIETLKKITSKKESSDSLMPSEPGSFGQSKPGQVPKESQTVSSAGMGSSGP